MKITVIGAGAIGTVVAAELACAGHETRLIARDEYVPRLNERGLRIHKPQGVMTVGVPVLSRMDGPADLVIFTTKTQDLEEAYQANAAYLEEGLILTTQNGVQADNILSTHFEKHQMLSSIVMFGVTAMEPGDAVLNFPGDWIIGRPFTPLDPTAHDIAQELGRAFSTVVSDDITGMKWLKLFVNFNNCLPALINRSMQETFADREFCRLSWHLLREGLKIVEEADITLVSLPAFPVQRLLSLAGAPEETAVDIIHQTMTGLSREPLYGSILQSLRRRKTTEIDFINGEVVRLAVARQRRAPLNERIVDMIHHIEQTGRFFTPQEVKDEFSSLLTTLNDGESVKGGERA